MEQLAMQLSKDHLELKDALRTARVYRNITVEEMGERMGVPTKTVEEFEAYYSNPTLSQIRGYALAVGVAFKTVVFYNGLD